jgi:hypothetical protein
VLKKRCQMDRVCSLVSIYTVLCVLACIGEQLAPEAASAVRAICGESTHACMALAFSLLSYRGSLLGLVRKQQLGTIPEPPVSCTAQSALHRTRSWTEGS